MPKVSIITPTYNVEPYIAQCIESVLAQTLTDWEMILVDDASTDGTVAVIERYLGDPRLKLFRNETNQGAGYTRNRCLDEATGEWIAILDSDDWYEPNRLERLVQFAEEMQADMVVDLQKDIDSEGKVLEARWSQFGENPSQPRYYTVSEVMQVHPAFKPLIRHQFLKEHQIRFVPDIRKSQDYAFYIEILLKGARFAVLPEALYCYRVRQGSITRTYTGQSAFQEITKSYKYLYQIALERRLDQEAKLLSAMYRKRAIRILYPYFAEYMKKKKYKKAWQIYKMFPPVFIYFIQGLPGAFYRRLLARDQLTDTSIIHEKES